jgi:hypothetical protein
VQAAIARFRGGKDADSKVLDLSAALKQNPALASRSRRNSKSEGKTVELSRSPKDMENGEGIFVEHARSYAVEQQRRLKDGHHPTDTDVLNISEALGQEPAPRPRKNSRSGQEVGKYSTPLKDGEGFLEGIFIEHAQSTAQNALQSIHIAQVGKWLLDQNWEGVSKETKKEAAQKLVNWATEIEAKEAEYHAGIKSRYPENPRGAIAAIACQGSLKKTKDASIEPYIIKFRMPDKEGLLSVEFPLANGGSKTVRHKLEYNASTRKIEYVIYSRIGKWIWLKSEKDAVIEELQEELIISRLLEEKGVGLHLTPKYSRKTGELRGLISRPAGRSADHLLEEPLPPGKMRYEGEALETRLLAMRGLLHFLKVIHAEGLAHQDVKPANLLVDHRERSGRPCGVVIDYATIKEIGSEKIAEGTPRYLPPEKRKTVSSETDCYAAGITLKELVRGEKAEVSPAEILHDLDPSDPIDQLIRRLCDPNPDTRMNASDAYNMMHEILRPLQQDRRLTLCQIFGSKAS